VVIARAGVPIAQLVPFRAQAPASRPRAMRVVRYHGGTTSIATWTDLFTFCSAIRPLNPWPVLSTAPGVLVDGQTPHVAKAAVA